MQAEADVIRLFSEQLKETERELAGALELVTEGLPPAEEQINHLNQSMTDLRSMYGSLKQLAFDGEDDPGDDEPAERYINIIKEREAQSLESRFNRVVSILEKFRSVQTSAEPFDEAIAPYREEAQKAISYLRSIDGFEVPEDYEADSNVKELFIRAVETDDFDTKEGMELLDQLALSFSPKVHQGLMLQKYYFPATGARPSEDEIAHDAAEELADDRSQPETTQNAKNEEELHPLEVEVTEDKTPSEQEPEEEASGDNDDTLALTGSSKVSKKISASSFKRDLRGAPELVRIVLPLITFFGCIGDKQLSEAAGLIMGRNRTDASIDPAIDFLVKKSLICSFEHEKYGTARCLSSYGSTLVGKESIRTAQHGSKPYWALSMREDGRGFDRCIPRKYAENRLYLIDMYIRFEEAIISKRKAKELDVVDYSLEPEGETLAIRLAWEGSVYSCVLVGDIEDIPSDAENVIIVNDDEDMATLPDDLVPGEVFLVRGGTIITLSHATDGETDNTEEYDEASEDAETDDAQPEASQETPFAGDMDEDEEVADEITAESDLEEEGLAREQVATSAPESLEPSAIKDNQSEAAGNVAYSNQAEEESARRGDGNEVPAKDEPAILSLVESSSTPAEEALIAIAKDLVEKIDISNPREADYTGIALAMSLLKASSQVEGYERSGRLLTLFDMATGLKMTKADRSGTSIAASFVGFEEEYEPLMLASYCIAMLSPQTQLDYSLKSTAQEYLKNYAAFFPSFPEFKQLLNELGRAHDMFISKGPQEGFSERVVRWLDDREASQESLRSLMQEAASLIDQPKFKTYVNGTTELSKVCFGLNSDLQECMKIVSEDRRSDQELVESVLNEYLEPGTREIADAAIDERIDREWKAAAEKDSSIKVKRISYTIRDKTVDAFKSRLDVIIRWLDFGLPATDSAGLSSLTEFRANLFAIVEELLGSCGAARKEGMSPVLYHALKVIEGRLKCTYNPVSLFTDFLRSGYISLDRNGLPVLDERANEISYFEPWRNVLRHLSSRDSSYRQAVDGIFDPESDAFDNLGQLEWLGKILGDDSDSFEISEGKVETAKESADAKTEEFKNFLEMAYLYNMINEVQKESLLADVRSFRDELYARKDFGCWSQFLAALRRQVDDASIERERDLTERLERCRAMLKPKQTSSLLDEAASLLYEVKNYAVAEEYLNRFESGETELTEEISSRLKGPDMFLEFISDDVFGPIYELCIRSKGKPVGSFALPYIKGRYPSDWTNRQKEDSEKLIKLWPVSQKRTSGTSISDLLRCMGIQTRGAEELSQGTRFQVKVKPSERDKADYPHPISAFGTKAISPLHVIVMYGNQTPQEIINRVAQENVVGMSMVIVNHPMSLAARRQMAEIFHTQQSRLNPFLLVDQVLAVYLASHTLAERLPLMLRCALPFTYYQPFVRDGGPTADEMFCGRTRELRTIMDPNGASVVYGGRQLGKTALLERAESLSHHPDSGEYAVYVSILSCESEEGAAKAISEAISKRIPDIRECKDLKTLCKQIDNLIEVGKATKLLLLVDEADRFLATISGQDYLPLQPLVDLKRSTNNRFKFVLAGLHNVCRAKNATANNGIFGQLGEPLCVRPLQPSEALQLIRRPLTYLGFQIDRFPHLETILTNTNYYPGILQFFGYELVESMTRQYGDYYRAVDGNPPYTLRPEQLGAIMNSAQLNNSIKEKFRWSLELDPRYFMIARCIAMLYYEYEDENGPAAPQDGFTVEEIRESAAGWQIHCLENETPSSFAVLLDEMVDMGILARPNPDKRRYRLRRYSFLNIIGPTPDSVFEDIAENNGE